MFRWSRELLTARFLSDLTGSLPDMVLQVQMVLQVYLALSADTLIGAYLMLGVANSSQTWVSGTNCLFSRNLQVFFYLTDGNESTASFIIHLMP